MYVCIKSCCPPVQNVPFSQVRGQPNNQKTEPDGVLETSSFQLGRILSFQIPDIWTGLWQGESYVCAHRLIKCATAEKRCLCHPSSILRNKDFWETGRELLRKAGGRDKRKGEESEEQDGNTEPRASERGRLRTLWKNRFLSSAHTYHW